MNMISTAVKYCFHLVLICAVSMPSAVCAAEYRQAAGIIDVRSTFSDGSNDILPLAQLAKDRGFEILIMNDHDRMVMEYGLPPFRNLIKKRVELNSINKNGARSYLDALREAQHQNPEMIIIPGSESAPFYYWTGNPLKENLTAHNHEKRLLTIGMEAPDDYEGLPVMHNGISTAYVKDALPELLLFLILLGGGGLLICWKGWYRVMGVAIAAWALLSLANSNILTSSPYNQYQGDQGIAPYQLVIDYVNAHGGVAVWNYPETRSGIRKAGPIYVDTPPYPGALIESHNYTAFAALYGDTSTITEPGSIWDMVLDEYCRGIRKRPVWGIATSDFHKEGNAGEKLGNFVTFFLLKEKSLHGALDALKNGKLYAYRGRYPQIVRLEKFAVHSPDGHISGVSGDDISLDGYPQIRCLLTSDVASEKLVTVRLIRSGIVIQTFRGILPIDITYEDQTVEPDKKYYYRVDMVGEGKLISNPIFVRYSGKSIDAVDQL